MINKELQSIIQSVGAYAHIIVIWAKLRLPDVFDASYFIILCWVQFISTLHFTGL